MAAITSTTESWNNHLFSEVESHIKSYYSLTSHTHSYLPLAGGTLSGVLTLSNGKDLELKAPSNKQTDTGDIVFKNYSGTEIGRFWLGDDDIKFKVRYGSDDTGKEILHSGNVKTINGNSIVGSGDITIGGGGGGAYLPLTGGTMTGTITSTAQDSMRFNVTNFTALRFYDGNSNFATIHGFLANVYTTKAGNLNLNGTDGVSIGDWENPTILVKPSDGVYFAASATSATNSAGFRIGRYDEPLGGLKMQFGGGDGTLQVINSGWTVSCFNLSNNGNLTVAGGVTAMSDIRHKNIVKDVSLKVEDVAKMPSVLFKWKDDRNDDETYVGSIAQEWQKVLPQVVLKQKDKEGTLSLNYGVAALVSSITTAKRVVNHEERIKQLEDELAKLKAEKS